MRIRKTIAIVFLILDELKVLGVPNKYLGDAIRNLNKYFESNPEVTPLSKEDFQDFINKFVEYANSNHGKSMKSKAAIFIGGNTTLSERWYLFNHGLAQRPRI